MKALIATGLFIITFSFQVFAASTKLVCISWMALKTEIVEQPVNEFGMAEINFSQGDWAYHADIFEGELNAINLIYKPLGIQTQANADAYPLNNLSTSINIKDMRATLDCDIRDLSQALTKGSK